jgi:hypothetical protein
MVQKIVNLKTGKTIYEGYGIPHDHGYWISLNGLNDLSKQKKDSWKYSEYYGGKYQLQNELESVDERCHSCNRKLPKKDRIIADEPCDIKVADIIYGKRDGWFEVCFR